MSGGLQLADPGERRGGVHPLRGPDDPARGERRRVRYFRCGSCHRWVSSIYTDIFRADAKMRTHPVKDTTAADARFVAVKDRLERWLAALEEQDPYRVLGVSPLDSPEVVRDALPRAGDGAAPGPGRLGGEDARAERRLRAHPPPPAAQAATRRWLSAQLGWRQPKSVLAGPQQVAPRRAPRASAPARPSARWGRVPGETKPSTTAMQARKGAQPSTSFTAPRPRCASAWPRGSSPGSMSAWPTISPAPPAMTMMDSSTGPWAAMKSSSLGPMPSCTHSAATGAEVHPVVEQREHRPQPQQDARGEGDDDHA